MKMILPLLLPLVLFFGGCKKKEPVDGGKSKEEITAPEPKSEEAKINAPTDSLADNIVGKVMTLELEGDVGQIQFYGDGRMMTGENGSFKDRGLTYKIEGNEVLVYRNKERDGGILFSSSSPKVGDQFKLVEGIKKMKGKITKIEASDEIEKPPTADELLDSMGTPLNEFEKIIADKKYLEKFVINTTDPNLYKGVAPAETINRTNRTYSILYIVNGEKRLVHGIWMIKGDNFYYMELVSDGSQISKEEREVYKATIITLDKEKSLFSLPSFEENLKEERVTWELIEKFTAIEMQKFNDEVTNKNFDIFKNNTVDKKK